MFVIREGKLPLLERQWGEAMQSELVGVMQVLPTWCIEITQFREQQRTKNLLFVEPPVAQQYAHDAALVSQQFWVSQRDILPWVWEDHPQCSVWLHAGMKGVDTQLPGSSSAATGRFFLTFLTWLWSLSTAYAYKVFSRKLTQLQFMTPTGRHQRSSLLTLANKPMPQKQHQYIWPKKYKYCQCCSLHKCRQVTKAICKSCKVPLSQFGYFCNWHTVWMN